MIDLGFLTEAEQEAILKVLQRDAELKKAEDERVRNLQNVVHDENELKYKSGQWFYEAKSKRHNDKIHGADLVRASIRKRKKPATIEQYGVMDIPDEADEDIKANKAETNHSAKKVNFLSSENLNNGNASPAKQRKNPFNSSDLVDETDHVPNALNHTVDAGQMNGIEETKPDIMSSIVKYGVKLPYPEPKEGRRVSQKAKEDIPPMPLVQPPTPKPRSFVTNGKSSIRGNSPLNRDDSTNGTNRRGILKRRSSTSSTDSESIRIIHSVEANRLALPVSPIPETVQNMFDEQVAAAEESPDRLKQVRFSETVHQKPPSPRPEPYVLRETDEFGILEPNGHSSNLNGDTVDGNISKKSITFQYPDSGYSEDLHSRNSETISTPSSTISSLEAEEQLLDSIEDLSIVKEQRHLEEAHPERGVHSTDNDVMYSTVTPISTSPDQDNKPERPPDVTNSEPDKVDSESRKADTLGPTTNSFPDNPEKLKRLSQSVPTFLQDDTDGRETDSASESSFQIGRHKKSPSSLTNLSGSSGMASMSSVSGSVMSMYSGDFGNVDVKGSIEFALDYVENLKEFLIYIYQCRELSAADVKKQRSDPYVKAYLLPEKSKLGKRKTAVKKKTLTPVYNEVLRYKIPKETVLAQTLNMSVWHHDTLGRNSFLGEVNVNLEKWDWTNTERSWYPLEPRTPAAGIGLENRGEIKLSLKYVPGAIHDSSANTSKTGEVHIWIIECVQLPMLRENKINSFAKCTILPDTSRKSRQKTRTVDKTPNPVFNHTMVYDGFKQEDLREACVELTVWDHTRLTNHFIGGLRLGLGTGKSYGTAVDWMDSSHEESALWEKMITTPNTWAQGVLPLRMFKMAKLAK